MQDIEHLRLQPDLFGSVPSDSTVFRSFHQIGSTTRAGIAEAMAEMRAKVWSRSSVTKGSSSVVLDIDASLVEIHTDGKEHAAPTYKGGFGFHPMFCFADAAGEVLSGVLRPGNAGANTVSDHLNVLDQAIAQLPATIATGHRSGDDATMAKRTVIVRADSAGCTEGFLAGCRARNVNFFVTARSNPQVTAAVFDAIGIETVWEPARTQAGEPRAGAAVCELTSLIADDKLPEGTRLIVRREPLHPGAQRSLFPSLEFRYWGFYTDAEGEPVDLDATMRAHAHVERHIQRLKDAGPLPDALHQLRGQRHLDDGGGHECRPGALVPAALLRRLLGRRPAQGHALGHLPCPGTARAPVTPTRRAHHRRVARHRCVARGL